MAAKFLFDQYKNFADKYFSPILTDSQFQEKGVLTPEEFVKAGDKLVFSCPTWQWASGEPSLSKEFLPADKQYLMTKNVPCLRRVHAYEMAETKEQVIEEADKTLGDDDGWLETHVGHRSAAEEVGDIESMESADQERKLTMDVAGLLPVRNHFEEEVVNSSKAKDGNDDNGDDDDESVPDMDGFDEENLLVKENEDNSTILPNDTLMLRVQEPEDSIIRTRTYDISISYDKFYRTPRVYLFGYNENGQPLKWKDILEDISAEHADKTVTLEKHPNTNIPQASIHPCKHGEVMKRIVGLLQESASKESAVPLQFNVEHYMFPFLKFINTIIPTINYDFTQEASI